MDAKVRSIHRSYQTTEDHLVAKLGCCLGHRKTIYPIHKIFDLSTTNNTFITSHSSNTPSALGTRDCAKLVVNNAFQLWQNNMLAYWQEKFCFFESSFVLGWVYIGDSFSQAAIKVHMSAPGSHSDTLLALKKEVSRWKMEKSTSSGWDPFRPSHLQPEKKRPTHLPRLTNGQSGLRGWKRQAAVALAFPSLPVQHRPHRMSLTRMSPGARVHASPRDGSPVSGSGTGEATSWRSPMAQPMITSTEHLLKNPGPCQGHHILPKEETIQFSFCQSKTKRNPSKSHKKIQLQKLAFDQFSEESTLLSMDTKRYL